MRNASLHAVSTFAVVCAIGCSEPSPAPDVPVGTSERSEAPAPSEEAVAEERPLSEGSAKVQPWDLHLALRSQTASVSAKPESSAVPTPVPRVLHCFSWVHHADFSSDCYPTAAACGAARQRMKAGSRNTTECRRHDAGACTNLSGADQRCFGDLGNCEKYRAYIAGNGLESTPCVKP